MPSPRASNIPPIISSWAISGIAEISSWLSHCCKRSLPHNFICMSTTLGCNFPVFPSGHTSIHGILYFIWDNFLISTNCIQTYCNVPILELVRKLLFKSLMLERRWMTFLTGLAIGESYSPNPSLSSCPDASPISAEGTWRTCMSHPTQDQSKSTPVRVCLIFGNKRCWSC